MSIKYYTHFLMQEQSAGVLLGEAANNMAPNMASGMSEFRGVVEVNRRMRRDDFREAARVLARNFECDVKDIEVLQWSLLH